MNYSADFVLRINEIYHDVEAGYYQNRHPEIYGEEASRWRKVADRFIAYRTDKIHILDIGCGAGFVPLQVGSAMKKGDVLVCSDISSEMLSQCKANLSSNDFTCEIQFHKLDGKTLDFEPNSFEFVTLNSVLHHVPDIESFLNQVDRILTAGGLLIIGHEPNQLFFSHKFLKLNYSFFSAIYTPKHFISDLLRKYKLHDVIWRIIKPVKEKAKIRDQMYDEINQRLLREKLIGKPLSKDQLTRIANIQVPCPGDRIIRGINLNELLGYLPRFELECYETYDHLHRISSKNQLAIRYSSYLKTRFPKNGAILFAILKKVIRLT